MMPSANILRPQVDPRHAPLPEQRLLIAILEDALTCFEKNYPSDPSHANRLFRDAKAWIMSEQSGVFSFEHICSVLGLDPDAVRSRLRRRGAERYMHASAAGRTDSTAASMTRPS